MATKPSPPDVPGVPGYAKLVEIGRGGDSVVYRAWSGWADRYVAVKVLAGAGPVAAERFRGELEITAALGRRHPGIVAVLDSGTTTGGRPYLVMPYYPRGSLHDQLAARGPLPVDVAVAAGAAVAGALAFAHAQGVLHGDVKPQNVLVGRASWVLADFGLARRLTADHPAAERFSYRHAAPQLLDGQTAAPADDVYSLGSTLYTLLDGRPPFADDDPGSDTALAYLRRARTAPPRPLTRPDLPAGLAGVVGRCLAKAREDRYPDAAAVHAALTAIPPGPAPAGAPRCGPGPGPVSRRTAGADGRRRSARPRPGPPR
ncbi:MAG: hypothetical protein V7637_5143 [Mycobacteriales bacterium]|jgi:serine/threonine protein kinase